MVVRWRYRREGSEDQGARAGSGCLETLLQPRLGVVVMVRGLVLTARYTNSQVNSSSEMFLVVGRMRAFSTSTRTPQLVPMPCSMSAVTRRSGPVADTG